MGVVGSVVGAGTGGPAPSAAAPALPACRVPEEAQAPAGDRTSHAIRASWPKAPVFLPCPCSEAAPCLWLFPHSGGTVLPRGITVLRGQQNLSV